VALSRTALARRTVGVRENAYIAMHAMTHHTAISAYASRAGPKVHVKNGGPLARSTDTPPSPPNHPGTSHTQAATSSPMPSVIIA
jgi:hypothetical protein